MWWPASEGGGAIGIHVGGGLSRVQNNTVYDTRGGQSGRPTALPAQALGCSLPK